MVGLIEGLEGLLLLGGEGLWLGLVEGLVVDGDDGFAEVVGVFEFEEVVG